MIQPARLGLPLHNCGLCMARFPTYGEAERCAASHCDGATSEQVATVRANRRKIIALAAQASCPVWFVMAMEGAARADRDEFLRRQQELSNNG